MMPDDVPDLTEADVVRVIREHIEGLFPRTCPNCKQDFATYLEYLRYTKPIGFPLSYDIELDDWKPAHSSGNLSLANCRCGNTLALSSDGMPLTRIWQVLNWIKIETERRGVKTQDILVYLREEVRKQALT
jgi:hypothetical protein